MNEEDGLVLQLLGEMCLELVDFVSRSNQPVERNYLHAPVAPRTPTNAILYIYIKVSSRFGSSEKDTTPHSRQSFCRRPFFNIKAFPVSYGR